MAVPWGRHSLRPQPTTAIRVCTQVVDGRVKGKAQLPQSEERDESKGEDYGHAGDFLADVCSSMSLLRIQVEAVQSTRQQKATADACGATTRNPHSQVSGVCHDLN